MLPHSCLTQSVGKQGSPAVAKCKDLALGPAAERVKRRCSGGPPSPPKPGEKRVNFIECLKKEDPQVPAKLQALRSKGRESLKAMMGEFVKCSQGVLSG